MISAIAASSLRQAEKALPTTFTVDGVTDVTFTGIFNRHQYAERLVIGGFEEDVDGTMVASKPQFTATTWIPNRGKRLCAAGKAFQIVGVTEDTIGYTFSLKGVNS